MKRKIAQQGPNTLGVSLPSKWIKKHNIKKGDEISLEEMDNKLLINPSDKVEIKKKTINIDLQSSYKQHLKLIITNAYRIGYDILNINFNNQKQFNLIKDITAKELIGYEITEKKGNCCKIESITEPPEDKVDPILKRMLFIIIETSNSILENIKNSSSLDLEYIKSQTYKIDQYTYFCKRTLSKKDFEEKSYLKWTLLTYLILVQHSYFRLIDYIIKKEIKPQKGFTQMLEKVNKYVDGFVHAFLKGDIKKFSEINEMGESLLYEGCYRLFENSNKEGVAIYHLAQVIRNIYLSTVPAIGIYMKFS